MKFQPLRGFVDEDGITWEKGADGEAMVFFTVDGLPQGLDFWCYFKSFLEAYIDCPDEFDDSVFGSI